MLLNIIIRQLSTATKSEFIQVSPCFPTDKSLIHVFATLLVLHPPGEILAFCSNTHVNVSEGTVSGLQVLLKTWTEIFEVLQGYKQIRLSVVALSRIFDFNLDDIIVKGDEIIEPAVAGRIVTRSQRRNGTPSNRLI